MCLYFDGSVIKTGNQNWAGAGYAVYRKEKCIFEKQLPLGNQTTINQAEMHAIHQSAIWITETQITDYDIQFYTDSKTTINKLINNQSNSKQTIATIDELNKLAITNHVQIIKIKAHVGVSGNEKADVLAKKAANTKIYGPEPFITKSQIDNQLRELAINTTKAQIKNHNMTEQQSAACASLWRVHANQKKTSRLQGVAVRQTKKPCTNSII